MEIDGLGRRELPIELQQSMGRSCKSLFALAQCLQLVHKFSAPVGRQGSADRQQYLAVIAPRGIQCHAAHQVVN